MANKERGEMRLVAEDGQEYVLRLTMNACCDVEDQSGKGFDDLLASAQQGKIPALRWLVWAALQEHHADKIAKPSDAGKLIDRCGGLVGVSEQMKKFIQLNVDDSDLAEGQKKANPLGAGAANGDRSTSTPGASASARTSSGGSRSSSSGASSPSLGKKPKPNGAVTPALHG